MDRLTALHAFVRLVELGSFSAVARDLRVAQSTVSKWLAALEDELGAQLVERTTRTQRVTDAGQTLYAGARDLLTGYDELSERLRGRDQALGGHLRVSAPVVFGRLHVAPVIARFLRRHAAVEIELVYSDRYVNVIDERFDVAIRVGVPVDSSLRARVLGRTGRHLVASPGYLKRRGTPRAPRDLEDHDCLLHTGLALGDTWVMTRRGETSRARVRGRFASNNSEALRTMARAGVGIALLATWMVDADLASGRLVEVLQTHELPEAPIAALTAPGRHPPRRLRALLDALSESIDVGSSR